MTRINLSEIREPRPQCPNCRHYVNKKKLKINSIWKSIWVCDFCGAEYEDVTKK